MQKSYAIFALSALWLSCQSVALAHPKPTDTVETPDTSTTQRVSQQQPSSHDHAHDETHQHDEKHDHTHDHDHGHDHNDDFTQLGTHVHGAATLTMVLEGNELQLALQSAAYNIVGFEHAPKSSEQKQEIALALDNLAQGNWFSLSAEANCEIQTSDANTDLTEPGYAGHGDFYANISLLCQRPALLQQLELSLFSLTPALEKVDVQWVLNGQQGAASATLSSGPLRF
ncbi:ZrgA family zinc uptake protein [Alishewanella tabrizica]|uniref:DUF2796 domain-containing protein n=1 Tax=Alishewanella tabrizica TaxID=671278 RepID=A0ABQ2WIC0_9ALTE|nr:DUF2796 domain-containing protein [Alishewanella tabrizica]GGW53006.1 hypothetical protein GCM10008111_06430 [Alishewanella tabrizica]